MDNKTLAKIVFCARFLYNNVDGGIEGVKKLFKNLDKYDTPGFVLVEIDENFFTNLAAKLRELWPPGEKDGKYPWRDSVANLARRLATLWVDRKLDNYTVDDVLRAANRYLARFEDNVKYMKTLKYFILKQTKIVGNDGKTRYINNSELADMLEGNSVFDTDVAGDWNDAFNSTVWEGELI